MLLNFHAHLYGKCFCVEKSNCSHLWKCHILYLSVFLFREVKDFSVSHIVLRNREKIKTEYTDVLAFLINNL